MTSNWPTTVSDTAAGDYVLQTVARRLKECTRSEDLVARLGGDEFAVVLAGEACRDSASRFAARIIEEVSAPFDYEGQNIEIGASVGVALAPHDAGNVDQLMKVADVALYQAKGEGRNLYRQFTANLLDRMLERRELEEEIEPCFGPRSDRTLLSAIDLRALRQGRQHGSVGPLEAPEAGFCPAVEIHPDCRGSRIDGKAWRLGDRGGRVLMPVSGHRRYALP